MDGALIKCPIVYLWQTAYRYFEWCISTIALANSIRLFRAKCDHCSLWNYFDHLFERWIHTNFAMAAGDGWSLHEISTGVYLLTTCSLSRRHFECCISTRLLTSSFPLLIHCERPPRSTAVLWLSMICQWLHERVPATNNAWLLYFGWFRSCLHTFSTSTLRTTCTANTPNAPSSTYPAGTHALHHTIAKHFSLRHIGTRFISCRGVDRSHAS